MSTYDYELQSTPPNNFTRQTSLQQYNTTHHPLHKSPHHTTPSRNPEVCSNEFDFGQHIRRINESLSFAAALHIAAALHTAALPLLRRRFAMLLDVLSHPEMS